MSAIRRSARAVILDEQLRVLLLHGLLQEDPPVFAWYAPGGRLEDNESFIDAAKRELEEELGLVGVEIGPLVWTRSSTRRRGDVEIPALAHFFLVRVASFNPDLSGIGESEIGATWRWWTVDELRATHERLIPPLFADLLEPLTRGVLPLDATDAS